MQVFLDPEAMVDTDEEALAWWQMPGFRCLTEGCQEECISAAGLITHVQRGEHWGYDGEDFTELGVDLDA